MKDYLAAFDREANSDICHFGVLGMKWGVRKDREKGNFDQRIKNDSYWVDNGSTAGYWKNKSFEAVYPSGKSYEEHAKLLKEAISKYASKKDIEEAGYLAVECNRNDEEYQNNKDEKARQRISEKGNKLERALDAKSKRIAKKFPGLDDFFKAYDSDYGQSDYLDDDDYKTKVNYSGYMEEGQPDNMIWDISEIFKEKAADAKKTYETLKGIS